MDEQFQGIEYTVLAQCFRAIVVFTINVLSHYTVTAWLMGICHCNPCNRHYESEAKCKTFVLKTSSFTIKQN